MQDQPHQNSGAEQVKAQFEAVIATRSMDTFEVALEQATNMRVDDGSLSARAMAAEETGLMTEDVDVALAPEDAETQATIVDGLLVENCAPAKIEEVPVSFDYMLALPGSSHCGPVSNDTGMLLVHACPHEQVGTTIDDDEDEISDQTTERLSTPALDAAFPQLDSTRIEIVPTYTDGFVHGGGIDVENVEKGRGDDDTSGSQSVKEKIEATSQNVPIFRGSTSCERLLNDRHEFAENMQGDVEDVAKNVSDDSFIVCLDTHYGFDTQSHPSEVLDRICTVLAMMGSFPVHMHVRLKSI